MRSYFFFIFSILVCLLYSCASNPNPTSEPKCEGLCGATLDGNPADNQSVDGGSLDKSSSDSSSPDGASVVVESGKEVPRGSKEVSAEIPDNSSHGQEQTTAPEVSPEASCLQPLPRFRVICVATIANCMKGQELKGALLLSGAKRVSFTLDASGSQQVSKYTWKLQAPSGSGATATPSQGVTSSFTVDSRGKYTIQLVGENCLGKTAVAIQTVNTID